MLGKQFVRYVSCGRSHSACLTEDGRIYTWGGDYYGLENGFPCLGLASETDWAQKKKSVTVAHLPQLVKSMSDHFVMSIACGGFHTVAITDLGETFSWGTGDRGQLGHGDNLDHTTPTMVEALEGRRIIAVECGDLHTLALGSTREVFTWGAGDCAQLGHGTKTDLRVPRVVKALLGEGVQAIAAGCFHNGAINKACSVYTWGAGLYGRLGHGDDTDCTMPRLVEDLERKGIRCLAMGLYHSIAVADNGDMYTWGRGSEGQLGHEDKTKVELKPRALDSLEGQNVRAVSAGDYHSCALNGDPFPLPETPNTITGWY